jgi:hypothetical protein
MGSVEVQIYAERLTVLAASDLSQLIDGKIRREEAFMGFSRGFQNPGNVGMQVLCTAPVSRTGFGFIRGNRFQKHMLEMEGSRRHALFADILPILLGEVRIPKLRIAESFTSVLLGCS